MQYALGTFLLEELNKQAPAGAEAIIRQQCMTGLIVGTSLIGLIDRHGPVLLAMIRPS